MPLYNSNYEDAANALGNMGGDMNQLALMIARSRYNNNWRAGQLELQAQRQSDLQQLQQAEIGHYGAESNYTNARAEAERFALARAKDNAARQMFLARRMQDPRMQAAMGIMASDPKVLESYMTHNIPPNNYMPNPITGGGQPGMMHLGPGYVGQFPGQPQVQAPFRPPTAGGVNNQSLDLERIASAQKNMIELPGLPGQTKTNLTNMGGIAYSNVLQRLMPQPGGSPQMGLPGTPPPPQQQMQAQPKPITDQDGKTWLYLGAMPDPTQDKDPTHWKAQ